MKLLRRYLGSCRESSPTPGTRTCGDTTASTLPRRAPRKLLGRSLVADALPAASTLPRLSPRKLLVPAQSRGRAVRASTLPRLSPRKLQLGVEAARGVVAASTLPRLSPRMLLGIFGDFMCGEYLQRYLGSRRGCFPLVKVRGSLAYMLQRYLGSRRGCSSGRACT